MLATGSRVLCCSELFPVTSRDVW
uniref:Uncharacterized protein n=1 Tax=Tetraselmis sp. GSL018 TaxID=582737 RepID=A0A061QRG0_9CHLO